MTPEEIARLPTSRSLATAAGLAVAGFAVALSLAAIACIVIGSFYADRGLILHSIGELRGTVPNVFAPIAAAPALAWFGIRVNRRAAGALSMSNAGPADDEGGRYTTELELNLTDEGTLAAEGTSTYVMPGMECRWTTTLTAGRGGA